MRSIVAACIDIEEDVFETETEGWYTGRLESHANSSTVAYATQ